MATALGGEVDDREILWNLGNCALQLGDDDAQWRFYSLALSRAREAGAVTAVVYALQRLCFSHFLAGDVPAVRTSAEEALSLGRTLAATRDDDPAPGVARAARLRSRAATSTTTCCGRSRTG